MLNIREQKVLLDISTGKKHSDSNEQLFRPHISAKSRQIVEAIHKKMKEGSIPPDHERRKQVSAGHEGTRPIRQGERDQRPDRVQLQAEN